MLETNNDYFVLFITEQIKNQRLIELLKQEKVKVERLQKNLETAHIWADAQQKKIDKLNQRNMDLEYKITVIEIAKPNKELSIFEQE